VPGVRAWASDLDTVTGLDERSIMLFVDVAKQGRDGDLERTGQSPKRLQAGGDLAVLDLRQHSDRQSGARRNIPERQRAVIPLRSCAGVDRAGQQALRARLNGGWTVVVGCHVRITNPTWIAQRSVNPDANALRFAVRIVPPSGGSEEE
jgi:hypothetical protein